MLINQKGSFIKHLGSLCLSQSYSVSVPRAKFDLDDFALTHKNSKPVNIHSVVILKLYFINGILSTHLTKINPICDPF
jgi:hypothetical protein